MRFDSSGNVWKRNGKHRNSSKHVDSCVVCRLWKISKIAFDVPFVLMALLDLQGFPLQAGINVQENVILDSFRSMLIGGFAFPRIVLARQVSSDVGSHEPNTHSRQ